MTAWKLPMPGVRDRVTGEGEESAGAEAAAGRGGVLPHQQQQWQNGYAAAVASGEQGRGSNSSRAGMGPSIMQPLPLASRYAGAAKQDTLRSSSAALGSSWIRRFLPSTGELGKEATRVPTKAVLGVGGGGAAGGGWESGSQPAGPLLLAPAPDEHKEQQQETGGRSKGRMGLDSWKEQQQETGGMGKGWMGLDSCRETSVKVVGNGDSMQKGKAPVEKEAGLQETTTSARDVGENIVRGDPLRKVNTLPSRHPYVVEGSSRLQQHQGNHRTVLSTRGESHADGNSGAVVTGFGPLRVVMKPPTRVQSWPKLKEMEGETRTEADVPGAAAQPDPHRLSTATLLPDRNKPFGTQTMASQTGTKFTPISKSRLAEDPWSGRPNRAGEFSSAWGFPRSKQQEVELDGARPSMVPPDGAAREIVGGSGPLKGVEAPGTRFNPFGEGNYQYRLDSGQKLSDHEGGVERMKLGSSKFSERFVSSYRPANLGRKEEGGQGTESRLQHSRGAEEATARPNNSGAGFPAGFENRKMKEVIGCGFSSRREIDTGGPSEQQHFQEIPPYASHQFQGGDMCIGKIGHPLPFSPHSSFGEDNSGEDTRNSRGRADRPKSPLTTPLDSPKPYEDELDGRAAQSQQEAPWTSLFAAFKGQDQDPEPANSSSSSPTLPPDVRSRLQDGSIPANRPLQGPKVNGDQDDPSGRNDAHRPASPEARSRFDNQSSHFSNSPWLDEENHIPNDEAGSGPYNSQATGSGYHTQASRVANRNEDDSKGKYMNAYRYGAGGGREGFGTHATRESSASEQDLRNIARNQVEDQGQQMTHGENQAAHRSHTPLEYFTRQAMSGHKDDTSGSSPPSYPRGYNSLEMGSSMLPRGIVDEHLLSIASKLKKVEVDPEMEGIRVPRTEKGYRKERVAFEPNRPMHNKNSLKRDNEAVYRDHMDVSAFPQRDSNYDVSRHGRSNERLEPGMRHGKLRTSGEAMGEGGISGPSKRTRHHPNLGASDFGAQMAGSGTPSSWLKRWLPPSTGNAAKSPTGFVRPKDNPRNGLTSGPLTSNGNSNNFTRFPNDHRSTEVKRGETARGKEIDRQGNETKARNGMTDVSGRRGFNGMPSLPIPSAAALALVGTAARKIGPISQQRRGSVSMWPPVHLQAAPEGQRPQSSAELSLWGPTTAEPSRASLPLSMGELGNGGRRRWGKLVWSGSKPSYGRYCCLVQSSHQ